jgi:aminoglycoside 6'-N-acetyltransferase
MPPLPYPHGVTAGEDVTLRLAREADAPLISRWTRAPEVHQHWGGRALEVEEVRAKYCGRRAPGVVSYVICLGDEPVGYLQAWQLERRHGLDMFVSADAQGRGIGRRAARALAVELTAAGWAPLEVDPAVDNAVAIRAWEAAGFRATREQGDGSDTLLMVFTDG